MKLSTILLVAVLGLVSFTYVQHAYALIVKPAASVTYETYNTCLGQPERHWTANWWGSGGCSTDWPKYQGVTIGYGNGHWRDHNRWQLTKTWMTAHGCITLCYQTTQSCPAGQFTAMCGY